MANDDPPLPAAYEGVRKHIECESRKRGKKFYKEFLVPAFARFYSLPAYQQCGLALNKATLAIAAISYWEDMLRLKSYHTLNVPDKHKQAAHIFKWISRLRPIKPVVDYAEELDSHLLEANAWFALACAQSLISEIPLKKSEEVFIVYSSMYRDIHAREWSMIFYLLEKSNMNK